MSGAAPSWFHNAVVTGVQNLYCLSLPGSPAAEVLPMTATAWVEALWGAPIAWDGEKDGIRLRVAFRDLALSCDRWPAPKTLLDRLPPRPDVAALPPPRPSAPPPGVIERLRALGDRLRMLPSERRGGGA